MRSDAKLTEHGASVFGVLVPTNNPGVQEEGIACQCQAEDVHGEGVEARALTAEGTLNVKYLAEITEIQR